MASLFGHAIIAATAARLSPTRSKPLRFWGVAALASILPDFDVVAFFFGIPYHSQWGHRGFTHSLVFAAVLGPLAARAALPSLKLRSLAGAGHSLFFALVTATHPLLDALTNGGLGVAIFWPFDSARYFLPYRPIEVSPIGAGAFFSAQGWAVVKSEALLIVVPCLILIGAQLLWRKLARSR